MPPTPQIHHDKGLFVSLLEQFLARKYWPLSFSSDSPVSQHTQNCVRLVALTKHKAHFKLSRNLEFYQHTAEPGELVVVYPSGYLDHWPANEAHWTFQCIYWENFIRFLYGEQDIVYWYHTSTPISPSGRSCLQALSQLSQEDQTKPQAQHLLRTIYHITYTDLLNDKPGKVTRAMETYHVIQDYLSRNFHSPMTNRESVAKSLRLSPQHVSRLFKEFDNDSFNARLKKLRLDYALNLLAQKELTLDEIAARCGFTSTGYFIREFRKAMSVPPGAYRQRLGRLTQ